jgi:hypothetical protein
MLITKVRDPEKLTAQHILDILAVPEKVNIYQWNLLDLIQGVLNALVEEGTLG